MTDNTMDPTFESVLRRRLKNLPDDAPLDPQAPLKELGLDSMEAVELVFDFEEEMSIALPDDVMTAETFATTQSLWSAVDKARTGSASSVS